MTGEEVKQMWNDLDSAAMPWRSTWRDLAKYIQPRRHHDMSHTGSGAQSGPPDKSIHAEVFDSTGVESNLTCARGQLAWMTPRGGRWLGYAAPAGVEETEAVKDYLQECAKIVNQHLLKSNFYTAIFELYLDRSGFGTACLSRSYDREAKRFQFRVEGDFVCSLGPDDTIDTILVRRCYSHRVAKKLFGEDKLPREIREAANNPAKWNETSDYIHAAIPNPDYRPNSALWLHMPYLSTWIHHSTGTVVSEGGMMDSPYLVTRFLTWSRTNPKAPYGWSPSFYAYPELCQVNKLEQGLDALVDVMVNPRILAPESMVGRVDMRAGGVTSIESMNNAPKEWLTEGRADVGHERAEQKRKRVEKAFMVDLFELLARLEDRERSATEIRARMSEKLDNASPTFDLLADELLKPLAKGWFATLAEAGELPEDVPPELLDADESGEFLRIPEVEFSSRIALEIRAQSDYAALTAVGEAVALMEVDPVVADQFDLPKIARNRFRSSGATEGLRTEGEVKRLQLQRQVTQQQMLEAQAQEA